MRVVALILAVRTQCLTGCVSRHQYLNTPSVYTVFLQPYLNALLLRLALVRVEGFDKFDVEPRWLEVGVNESPAKRLAIFRDVHLQ